MASTSRSTRRASALLALLMSFAHVQAQDSSPTGPTFPHTDPYCDGWHTIVDGDNCYSIEQEYGISHEDFLRWNRDVSDDCTVNFWKGNSYCVHTYAESTPQGPTFPNTVSDCNKWHTIASGDTCWSLQQEYDITLDEFLEWNPDVNDDCSVNFWLGNSYCIGVGDPVVTITTSTSPTTTSSSSTSVFTPTTTTPYSTKNPVTSYDLTEPVTATALPPEKTQSGQPDFCNRWHWVGPGQTCESVINSYSNTLTMEKFLEWNPTILEDCSGLFYGWYVCVGIQPRESVTLTWSAGNGNASIPSPTEFTPPVVTAVPDYTPTPQNPGIPDNCQNFYQAQSGDTCNDVLEIYNYITKEQFFAWNPALDENCAGMWAGYYYAVSCFDDGALPLPGTVTADPSPTASGTVDSCKSWYKAVGNDDCAAISLAFGTFSEDDFISWNPSVQTDCSGIKQGVFYCVSIPETPTTRTAVPTTTRDSFPTQTGLADDCTQYWLVSPADTCDSIISKAGISVDDFYAWNPAVGTTSCSGLKTNYYVCISTSPVSTFTASTTTITPGVSVTDAPTTTTTTSKAVTTTSGGDEPVSTPSPYMPGMIDGCVRFWFRGDDSADLYCYDIAAAAGVSLSDFYKWNPGVGENCASLWASTWYCVGVNGTPTTMSTGAPVPT